jgi:hypothetical protein
MDMNIEVDPDWGGTSGDEPIASTVASDRGAGMLGFAGTGERDTVAHAAGLTTLGGDEFGGGAKVPMLPGTWGSEQPCEVGQSAPTGASQCATPSNDERDAAKGSDR